MFCGRTTALVEVETNSAETVLVFPLSKYLRTVFDAFGDHAESKIPVMVVFETRVCSSPLGPISETCPFCFEMYLTPFWVGVKLSIGPESRSRRAGFSPSSVGVGVVVTGSSSPPPNNPKGNLKIVPRSVVVGSSAGLIVSQIAPPAITSMKNIINPMAKGLFIR